MLLSGKPKPPTTMVPLGAAGVLELPHAEARTASAVNDNRSLRIIGGPSNQPDGVCESNPDWTLILSPYAVLKEVARREAGALSERRPRGVSARCRAASDSSVASARRATSRAP